MHQADRGRPAAGPAAGPAATTSRASIDRSAKSSPSLHRSTSTTAIHSTSYAVRRSRSKHLRSQASLESLPDMISPEEYAALPASIQKKYFSSKERLCIAQQGAAQSRKKQHGKLGSWLSSPSTSDLSTTRPSTSGGLHSLKPKARTHDPKLFLVRFDDDAVSEEEARWFLSLPEKIKTKRFSREELVSLTAKCHRALGRPSPDTSRDRKRRSSVHRLEPSACTPIETTFASSLHPSTAEDTDSTPPPPATITQVSSSAPATRRIPTDVVEISNIKNSLQDEFPEQKDRAVETAADSADAEMEILKLYLQRRSMKTKALGSNTKRSAPGSPPAPPPQPTKRKAYHRTHFLTPLPLPPPVLAPAPRPQLSTPFSASARLSRPFINDDPLALDGQDQLEECKTAHHTHDEKGSMAPALHVHGEIFELPAYEEPLPTKTEDDNLYPHLMSAFSDDDTEDDDNNEKDEDNNLDTESVETVGPRTPSPLDHREIPSQGVNGDSGISLPGFDLDGRPKTASSMFERTQSSASNYSSLRDSAGSQPHVLRTSSEDMLYAYQRRIVSGVDVETSDPLALQTLPVCEDETGAHGAFAVAHDNSMLAPTKGLKRVFKSLKL